MRYANKRGGGGGGGGGEGLLYWNTLMMDFLMMYPNGFLYEDPQTYDIMD